MSQINEKKDLLLLLNYIFNEQPQLIHKITKKIITIAEFKENIYNQELNLSQTQITKSLSLLSRFNPDNYKEKLNKLNIEFITIDEENYPNQLREIAVPPPLLFYQGNIDYLQKRIFAVVGSRNHSKYGEQSTQEIVKELLPYFIIISGLALGIDTIAHKTALENGYPTIAIVATGLDITYPLKNTTLTKNIKQQGLILSEYPPSTELKPYFFSQRNRIVSGLCEGLLIAETKLKSGTMITANHAIEQNREVFAIPGPILSDSHLGCHKLIQDGAKLVHTINDILNEFGIIKNDSMIQTIKESEENTNSKEENKILQLIKNRALNIEEIMKETEFSLLECMQLLTLLKFKNLIIELPGKHYQKANESI